MVDVDDDPVGVVDCDVVDGVVDVGASVVISRSLVSSSSFQIAHWPTVSAYASNHNRLLLTCSNDLSNDDFTDSVRLVLSFKYFI